MKKKSRAVAKKPKSNKHDELRMPADKFDEMMRDAFQASPAKDSSNRLASDADPNKGKP